MIQFYFLLLILFTNKFISNIIAVQLIVEKTCNPKLDHGPDHCDIQHHKFYLVPNGSKHEHLQKQKHKEKEKEQEKIQIHQIWVDEKVAVLKHNGELFLFHKKYIKKCEIGNEQNEIMHHPGKNEEGSNEMMDKISIDSNDEDDDGKGISKRNLLKHKKIVKKENHIGKRELLHKLLINLFACGTKQWKSKNKENYKALKNADNTSNSKSHNRHHISIDKKEEEKLDIYSASSSLHKANSMPEELGHFDLPNTAMDSAANAADEHSTISDSASALGHKIGKNVEKIQAKSHLSSSHSFIQPETIINQIQLIQNITENKESNTADEIGSKASADGDIHSELKATDQSSHQKKHDEKFDEKNSESEGTSSLNDVNKVHSPLIVCNKEEKWLKVGQVKIKERVRNGKEKCIAKVKVPEKKLLEGSVFRMKDELENEHELFYNLEQIDGHGHKTQFMQKTDIMQKIKIDKDLEECVKEVCHENLLNIKTVNSIETIYMKEEHRLD